MLKRTNVDDVINKWMNDPQLSTSVAAFHTKSAQNATLYPFPTDIHSSLIQALHDQGIARLYSHQLETWEISKGGGHPVIVTGTASGKTLCYNLPVLDHSIRDHRTRALYIFPTKALATDQLEHLSKTIDLLRGQELLSAESYDGDTPSEKRPQIRQRVNFLLTNPDMLHTAILPHHTLWADYFRHLKFIIIDEIHIYRGIFGSHVANIIRRLKRISQFYGSKQQFLMTSATIANPKELAEHLVEEDVNVIDKDGSSKGKKFIVFYNPPLIKPELGIRSSPVAESVRLAGDLLAHNVQTCFFGRSRRTVEILLHSFHEQHGNYYRQIRGYRSGYLPKERRSIEKSLRSGDTLLVAATNALELGIDIGTMNAVVLVGYPGSVAATHQQFGRAGRRKDSSLALLIASAGPLDQFIMKHPEFILERSAERGLINPDNLLILLQHLRCAAFELPFNTGDKFGTANVEVIRELLYVLQQNGTIHHTQDKYYWMANDYPASGISLRSASAERVLLQCENEGMNINIGEVDKPSAMWMVHPNAIYMHEGQSYIVKYYDPDNNVAHLKSINCDYFTIPKQQVSIEKITTIRSKHVDHGLLGIGDLEVISQVVGFSRINWLTREKMSIDELELPSTTLRTMGCWLIIDQNVIDCL